MSQEGVVNAIHVAPTAGGAVEGRDAVEAVAGRGLRGDRYFQAEGSFDDREGSDLTLIEREALDAVAADYGIDLAPGAHRRNVTTEGIALNHLVGERFTVGTARCEGVELCEPCAYLERTLEREGVREALVHRGGLRARIVADGAVAVGDTVALR